MLEVAVHDVDQLVEGTLVRERLPALAAVERELVGPDAEGGEPEAWVWAELVGARQDEVPTAHGDVQPRRSVAGLQEGLKRGDHGRQPGGGGAAGRPAWGHAPQCAAWARAAATASGHSGGRRPLVWSVRTTTWETDAPHAR